MTSQTKRFIELSDVLALHFECKRCKATLTVPILREELRTALKSCPNCREDWAVINGSSYALMFEQFVEQLNKIRNVLNGRPPEVPAAPVGFSFSLEIKEEALPIKAT